MQGTILITGGSRGIGAATSLKLVEAGYNVCINYKENELAANALVNQINRLGRKAISIQADISIETDVLRMFKKIDEEFDRITGLVNNAAIIGKT